MTHLVPTGAGEIDAGPGDDGAAVTAAGPGARARRRTLLITAAVAVVALLAGLLAGRFIHSTAEAASRAQAPDASPITVPVEWRTLETEIVTRGDAGFAGSADVELDLGGLETPPVVTGHVPEAGDDLVEGEPLLEVVGRPVIALAGELPMYRSLRPGMSGPDVVQLKETLRRLGLNPGAQDDRYTNQTGQAVAELFRRAGYEPPTVGDDVAGEVAATREAMSAAEEQLAAAEQALRAAGAGPSESERVAAQNRVDEAKRQLAEAERSGDADEIARARAELAQAEADQAELLAPSDTSAEQAARRVAREVLSEAQQAHSEAQARAGTPLPASEVYYLATLPRRVDDVSVSRGDLAQGVVMSVSAADLLVTARVSDGEGSLLTEEMVALLDLPSGPAEGTITAVRRPSGEGASGYDLTITPEELTPEQVDELRSRNLRITIPVNSTDGEVLAVPLAALTAGPGGESRVEVWRDGSTELVVVSVGLVAQGYAEVTAVEGELAAGDLTVVGQSAADAADDTTADDE